jgi:hypothetical protein
MRGRMAVDMFTEKHRSDVSLKRMEEYSLTKFLSRPEQPTVRVTLGSPAKRLVEAQ